jgi:hypothetical protein
VAGLLAVPTSLVRGRDRSTCRRVLHFFAPACSPKKPAEHPNSREPPDLPVRVLVHVVIAVDPDLLLINRVDDEELVAIHLPLERADDVYRCPTVVSVVVVVIMSSSSSYHIGHPWLARIKSNKKLENRL